MHLTKEEEDLIKDALVTAQTLLSALAEDCSERDESGGTIGRLRNVDEAERKIASALQLYTRKRSSEEARNTPARNP